MATTNIEAALSKTSSYHANIEEAHESDIPTLCEVYIAAVEADVLTRFLAGHTYQERVKNQTESLSKKLGERFTKPTNRCEIHKAIDPNGGGVVGWSLVRWEDGHIDIPEEKADETFLEHYRRLMMKGWMDVSMGQAHVVLGGLYVRPEWQGKGVGRKMVEHLYERYNLVDDPVVVQTTAPSEGFWQKLGWETGTSADIDLSRWAGHGKGYGVHRSPQMLR